MFRQFLIILWFSLLVLPAWGFDSLIHNDKNVVQNTGKIIAIKKHGRLPVSILVSFKNGETKEYTCDSIRIFQLTFKGDLIKKKPLACASLKEGMLVQMTKVKDKIFFYVSGVNEIH